MGTKCINLGSKNTGETCAEVGIGIPGILFAISKRGLAVDELKFNV
jgi:hypothetical protein